MKKLKKTEQFIKLLKDALWSVDGIVIVGLEDPGIKDHILKQFTRSYFTLHYHLTGRVEGTSIVTPEIENDAKIFISKYHKDELYPDIVLEVMKMPRVGYMDVGEEFWKFCPDQTKITDTVQIFKVKFKDVLSEVPDPEENSLESVLFNKENFYNKKIEELKASGLLTEREADFVLLKVIGIIEMINDVIDSLERMFNKFKLMENLEIEPEKLSLKTGLESIYNENKLSEIFDRLSSKGITKRNEKPAFLALFTDNVIGKVTWNGSAIHGAQTGLFDLMVRITGKEDLRAKDLKQYFSSNESDKPIHDKWWSTRKKSPLVDDILKDI